MIFAVIDGIPAIYPTWDSYHAATFSPDSVYTCHPLRTYGSTYTQRREHLRKLAQDITNANKEALTPAVNATLQGFFLQHGKKYGLLTEFKKIGII